MYEGQKFYGKPGVLKRYGSNRPTISLVEPGGKEEIISQKNDEPCKMAFKRWKKDSYILLQLEKAVSLFQRINIMFGF